MVEYTCKGTSGGCLFYLHRGARGDAKVYVRIPVALCEPFKLSFFRGFESHRTPNGVCQRLGVSSKEQKKTRAYPDQSARGTSDPSSFSRKDCVSDAATQKRPCLCADTVIVPALPEARLPHERDATQAHSRRFCENDHAHKQLLRRQQNVFLFSKKTPLRFANGKGISAGACHRRADGL